MPPPIEWNPTVDPSGLVSQARDALAAGGVVVLPGDCGPLAVAKPGALPAHLTEPALLCWGPDEASALGLVVSPVARRLMFRGWPAPLVLELPSANGPVRVRCPEHPVVELLAQAVADLGPLHVADAPNGVPAAALVVTAELQPGGGAPTLIRATDAGFEILREGAFPRSEVERLAARIILFVCTGNTCRSPLAEALAKVMLAERLGCEVAHLPARGFWVLSAGVAAYGGDAASPESVATAAEHGADLSRHASRPVNPQLLLAADDVICMTRGHLHALARYTGSAPVARLMCGEEDLDDPIGAGPEVYRACAGTIRTHLERFLSEWVGA